MKVNKKKFLLTDTLPQELPLIFSNVNLYNFIREHIDWSKLWIGNVPSVPHQYYIIKSNHSKRIMSLVHPLAQLQMLKFVEQYDQEIIDFCNQHAIFSIRYPGGINSSIRKYDDKIKNETKFLINEDFEYRNNEHEAFIDNYFVKKRYKRLSKFLNSNLFRSMESKYHYLHKLDFQNCFEHIYTHSLDWAYLGDRDISKQLIHTRKNDHRFSQHLVTLMCLINDNETNGVVIGPELSRSVAEIVLMRIDFQVYKRLQKEGVVYKTHYEVVRFIDDILIFTRSVDLFKKIEKYYEEESKLFRMEINKTKVFTESRPFLRESSWRPQMGNVLEQYFDKLLLQIEKGENCEKEGAFDTKESEEGKHSPLGIQKKRLRRTNTNLIEHLRSIMIEYGSSTEKIITYLYIAFDNRIRDIFEHICELENQMEHVSYFLISFIDLLQYTLSFSITSTHVLQFVGYLTKIYTYAVKKNLDDVLNYMHDKCCKILKYNLEEYHYELLNLILFTRRFRKDISEQLLIDSLNRDPRYLTLSTVIFYLNSNGRHFRYKKTRELINKIVVDIVESAQEKYLVGPWYSPNTKNTKIFLTSDAFYPIHDFFNSNILSVSTRSKLQELKNWLLKITWSEDEDELFLLFWEYSKGFDRPFMNLTATDDDLVPLILWKQDKYGKTGY